MQLVKLRFLGNSYQIANQDPYIASLPYKREAEQNYLPYLLLAWRIIEDSTGYRWKCTSYWRRSPSHQYGVSLDLAPDISARSERLYSFSKMSDPVLYKREALLRKLQVACANMPEIPFLIGIFVEPDHLHLQVLRKDRPGPFMRLVKWKQPKTIYPDTLQRMALPLIRT